MKKILTVCLIISLLFSFNIVVSAEEDIWEPDLTAEMTDEFREVMKDINLDEVAFFLKNNNAIVEYGNAIEIHGFKTETLITAYTDSGKNLRFGDLINENGGWNLPVTSDAGREVFFIGRDLENKNKWAAIFGLAPEIFTDPTHAEYASIFTKSILEKSLPEGAEYKIVQMPDAYGAQMAIYYEVDNVAYLRPLDSRPYGAPLKQGVDYEANKLLEEWSQKYVDKEVELGDVAGGGTSYELVERVETAKIGTGQILLIVGICGIFIAIVGFLIVFILSRKKKKS